MAEHRNRVELSFIDIFVTITDADISPNLSNPETLSRQSPQVRRLTP